MQKPKRVVSLIASSTEITCALGYADLLVGRSHECDYPPEILHLPICSEVKFIADGTSYQIDERVKAILQEGLSVYRVKAEMLKALRPDVILTQIQCAVCAVSEKDVKEATCEWTGLTPEIVSLSPDSLGDVWEDIRRVAKALGPPERGEELIERLRARMRRLSERAHSRPARPRVAVIEWIEPLMAAGNWIPTLIEMAGGENLFGDAGKHSPYLQWETLRESDPDVIIISPCGFDISRTRQETHCLERLPGWHELRAVREERVFLADGNAYFNRPGPRVVETLEILVELLHPGPEDRGMGWERLEAPAGKSS